MDELVAPRRFRRRLTIAFVAFVGLSSGFLAVTSYFMFREYRFRIAASQADRRVALALPLLPAHPRAAIVEHALAEYQQRGGFDAVVVAGGKMYSSRSGLTISAVPDALLRDVTGTTRHRFTSVDGVPYRVVGRLADDGATRIYFFFPRADVLASIAQFRNVEIVGWLLTILFAAIAGQVVARRTLRPVREAARASRRLAQRLLDESVEPQSDDEFGLWVQSFNEVAIALETKIAELSNAAERERRFTSDVAHELRTPLTAMTSTASMINERIDDLPDHAREPARLLVHDVNRLRDLVLELLELARLDAGGEAVVLERLSLHHALGSVLRHWRGRVSIDAQVDPRLEVMADRARFKRVITNLVNNAIEHGRGTIVVRAHRDDELVHIEVADDGPGIAEEHIQHIFDRFFKADRSRSRSGSGLGLAIALEHARGQGGSLRAENRDGHGACFTFTLPAAAAADIDRDELVTSG